MRIQARAAVGSVVLAVITVLSAVIVALTATVQSAVGLLASTALIVPGTGTSNPLISQDYTKNAINYYIAPVTSIPTCATDPCSPSAIPVPYLAQFWPFPFAGWGGLQGAKWNNSVQTGVVSLSTAYGATRTQTGAGDETVIFGYSQGATVASIFKRSLAELPGGVPDNVSFVLIGDPNRPDGGLFERLAILGTLPILEATFGQPTPTDTSPFDDPNTVDIAFQYDGVADFPAVPWNLLAVANGLAGFWYVHGTYLDPRIRPPATTDSGELAYGYTPTEVEGIVAGCKADATGPNCQQHGDTIYVTLPARSVPILQPFIDLGTATGTSALINPAVALIQPITQTMIETAYNRTDYGAPTPFQLIPRINPIKVVTDLIQDVPEGINAAIATIQSPTHKIPDLPPLWGTGDSATATLKVASQEPESTPELPTSELRELLPLNKSEDDEATPSATASKRAKARSDFRPLRDLANAAHETLGPPAKEVEKALSRLQPRRPAAEKKADKPAAEKEVDKPAA